jgi:hypothetical protein
MSGCSSNWAAYLMSLKSGAEGRGFNPYRVARSALGLSGVRRRCSCKFAWSNLPDKALHRVSTVVRARWGTKSVPPSLLRKPAIV